MHGYSDPSSELKAVWPLVTHAALTALYTVRTGFIMRRSITAQTSVQQYSFSHSRGLGQSDF